MMSEVESIILIYLIKTGFSYLFSTSEATFCGWSGSDKKYSERRKQKFKDRIKSLRFFVLSLGEKKIIYQIAWICVGEDTEVDLEYVTLWSTRGSSFQKYHQK